MRVNVIGEVFFYHILTKKCPNKFPRILELDECARFEMNERDINCILAPGTYQQPHRPRLTLVSTAKMSREDPWFVLIKPLVLQKNNTRTVQYWDKSVDFAFTEKSKQDLKVFHTSTFLYFIQERNHPSYFTTYRRKGQ